MKKYLNKIFKNPLIIGLKKSINAYKNEQKYPTSYIGYNTEVINTQLGEYTTIKNDSLILNSDIGDYTYLSHVANVTNTKIGKFCSIGPNFKSGLGKHPIEFVSTHPIFFSVGKQCQVTFSDQNYYLERESINIGNDVWIGANVIILDGITIGNGAIIGAGSVVTKNVDPYSIVGGVPAKIIKYRFDEEKILFLNNFEWWNKDKNWLKENFKNFHNIDNFINKYKQ